MGCARTAARAFTLIELLVVIAIIGILSAVVLASLNAARDRGKESAIKATLKSMVAEIELMAESQPNYDFVNDCHTTGHVLAEFVSALADQGATVRCDSFNFTTGTTDTFTRWGVAASIVGEANLKAWSASPEGVVTWDSTDSNGGATANWANAIAACANIGKRLPAPEEYRALWRITSPNPAPGFVANLYWSRTEVPGVSANAYYVGMGNGYVDSVVKANGLYVRCVK